MKKLDPRELRKKVEKAPLVDDPGYEEDLINLRLVFKKSLRRKKLIFFIFSFFYVFAISTYLNKGNWFEKKGMMIFNTSSNNSFFKYLEESVGDKSKESRNELESYSAKVLTALKSESFLNYCYEEAVKDNKIAKMFNLEFNKKEGAQKSKLKIKDFFLNTFVLENTPYSPVRKTAQIGIKLTIKHTDPSNLEEIEKITQKLIKDYLLIVDTASVVSAREVFKNQIQSIEQKILEINKKKSAIFQTIPFVEKSSIYDLQSQLQATKITISGNKALEEQFQESISNIEKKISTIGDTVDAAIEPNTLSLELSSLSKQKSQLISQGLEKESFLYKNIASSLSKTLKELEESQKNFSVNQKKDESLFFQDKVATLNKFLDEINSLIASKLEKSLASDLEKSLSINFPENTNSKATSVSQAPVLSQEALDGLLSQLESLKNVIEGNSFFESKLNQKISVTKKRLSSLRPNLLEQKDISGYVQDISNMAYLKNQLKLQGVDEDSVIAKRITENIKKATKELQDKKNISLKDIKIGDIYTPTFDESSVYSQRVNLEKLKSDNNFYQAKIVELNKAIDELSFLLSDKEEKENKVFELDQQIKSSRVSLDILRSSLEKLTLEDFKAKEKILFVFESPQENFILPIGMFSLATLLLSFILGILISYSYDVYYPSLKTIESFEDLGLEVLGGLPSTKNNLLQEGSVLDGLTNASYLRMGISIENIMSSFDGKVILLTSSDTSLKSATIALNLGAFFGNTGKKILILETDLVNNSVAKVTGAPLNGGISELYLHKEKINFYPFRVSEGLDVLTGDPLLVPPVYRLVSNNFKTFLEQLSMQYDYVFLHVRPCLDSPEASDLSRYADMGIVCCDTETINKPILDKLDKEMNGFLSKKTCLILENPKDLDVQVDVKPEIQKAAA